MGPTDNTAFLYFPDGRVAVLRDLTTGPTVTLHTPISGDALRSLFHAAPTEVEMACPEEARAALTAWLHQPAPPPVLRVLPASLPARASISRSAYCCSSTTCRIRPR